MKIATGLAAVASAVMVVGVTALPAAAATHSGTTTCGSTYTAMVKSRTIGLTRHEYSNGRNYEFATTTNWTVRSSQSGARAVNWQVIAPTIDYGQTFGQCVN